MVICGGGSPFGVERFGPSCGIRQGESLSVIFNATVQKAEAMLKGFRLRCNHGAHHVLAKEVDLDIPRITGGGLRATVHPAMPSRRPAGGGRFRRESSHR